MVRSITSDDFNVSIISPVEVSADPEDASFAMGTEGALVSYGKRRRHDHLPMGEVDPSLRSGAQWMVLLQPLSRYPISNPVPLVSIGAS